MQLLPKDSEFTAQHRRCKRTAVIQVVHYIFVAAFAQVVLVQRFSVYFVNLNALAHSFPERTYAIMIMDK